LLTVSKKDGIGGGEGVERGEDGRKRWGERRV